MRRAPQPADLFQELVIDNFAGGGGASLGIEQALGRAVDVAVNHDRLAVAMHRVNHPHTRHLCEDVFKVDPRAVAGGKPVGLAWFSPDCTYFSKARGAKPIRESGKKSRGLAWVVIRYAATIKPRVIMLENVEEFQQWGPLDDAGKPCKKRKGRTFRSWVGELRRLGYDVQWRELRACDYGAPTIRKRLFLIARCDGRPIIWPPPGYGVKHGENSKRSEGGTGRQRGQTGDHQLCIGKGGTAGGRPIYAGRCDIADGGRTGRGSVGDGRFPERNLKPFRTAAECIDWTLPCPSICARKRPLSGPTRQRIDAGLAMFPDDPFLIAYFGSEDGAQSIALPLRTITTKDRFALIHRRGDDIGMRMLQPRELFRAQGFGDDYVIEHGVDETGGRIAMTKTQQVKACGNSVCPPVVAALVRANLTPPASGVKPRPVVAPAEVRA